MVFQEQGLFPWMKVWENVAFGLEMQDIPIKERRPRSLESLGKFGLRGFEDRYPHELSGGMKQRVALARAFLTNPQILLMDEPFRSLDDQTKLVLQAELLRVWKTYQQTVVYVTHDIEEAVLLGDRILVMTGRPGRIRDEITVPLERPRELTPRTQAVISETKWSIWKMLEDEVRKGLSEVV
jgi:NitT/TauT family transport system ATP-binding protein